MSSSKDAAKPRLNSACERLISVHWWVEMHIFG
jgi:hypothetical protein